MCVRVVWCGVVWNVRNGSSMRGCSCRAGRDGGAASCSPLSHASCSPLFLSLMCRWVGGVGCHVTFTWHWEKLGLEGSGDGELLLQVRGSKGGGNGALPHASTFCPLDPFPCRMIA